MEACLVEVYPEHLKHVSEYLTQRAPQYISDSYDGDIKHIPFLTQERLMSCGPDEFKNIKCRGVFDFKDGRDVLKDAVVWTTNTDAGGPGESRSGIFGLSPYGNIEMVSMYIGRVRLEHESLLISNGMKATIDYFSAKMGQQLKIYNPNSLPAQVGHQPQASDAHEADSSADIPGPGGATGGGLPQPSQTGLTPSDEEEVGGEHYLQIHPTNAQPTPVPLNQSPNTHLSALSKRQIFHRDAKVKRKRKSETSNSEDVHPSKRSLKSKE